jgi:hypothetical protein
MRDKRFIAVHRGGPLTKEHHHLLMNLACVYAEHILPLIPNPIDICLQDALSIARLWTQGAATVGDARKASVAAHAYARSSKNPVEIAASRAVGHAVATAHMADHSLGPAYYALKAVKSAGLSVEQERKWQDEQLPAEIKELYLTAREIRKI